MKGTENEWNRKLDSLFTLDCYQWKFIFTKQITIFRNSFYSVSVHIISSKQLPWFVYRFLCCCFKSQTLCFSSTGFKQL